MKKALFAVILACGLASCNPNKETIIKNNSDYIVSFQYTANGKTQTLDPGETQAIDWHIETLANLQPWNRVSQSRDKNYVFTIFSLPSYEVFVYNRTSTPITLTAGGWMDDMVDIQPGWEEDDNHKGRIYTNTPNFYVPGHTFPLDIQYQFNGAFYVVIRE